MQLKERILLCFIDMSKNTAGPYDQYDDLQLLQRYTKLKEDHEKYYELPAATDFQSVDYSKASVSAEKLDKIIIECYVRGLMGKSELDKDGRKEVAKQALALLKNPSLGECTTSQLGQKYKAAQITLKEYPYSQVLTKEALFVLFGQS
jgi:hypothetical protein